LEAATGHDFSEDVQIASADGMTERAYRFVLWLAEEDPDGGWQQFIDREEKTLLWDRVIVAGASHGSTTAARFAKHQKVRRVVMFCGPRDQHQVWQTLESATPKNRFFGFSHTLDGGWSANHYCRSWELLGLHQFGPIVDVDTTKPPYGNSRRLVSSADVGGDDRRAHGAVTPSTKSPKAVDGSFQYEPVWRYLFTHPTNVEGDPVERDPDCTVAPQEIPAKK